MRVYLYVLLFMQGARDWKLVKELMNMMEPPAEEKQEALLNTVDALEHAREPPADGIARRITNSLEIPVGKLFGLRIICCVHLYCSFDS